MSLSVELSSNAATSGGDGTSETSITSSTDSDWNTAKYSYVPICTSQILITMKHNQEVHIILRTHLADNSDIYKIIIRRQPNTICEIKRNTINVITVDIKSIHDVMSKIILLKWYCDGTLIISGTPLYNLDENIIIMSYKDKYPFVINYIGANVQDIDFSCFEEQYHVDTINIIPLTSQHIVPTEHIVQVMRQQLLDTCHYWLPKNEEASRHLVKISEAGGYIGRARLVSAVIPGIIIEQRCIISYHAVYHMENYDVLHIPRNKVMRWVLPECGKIPLYALPAGEAENGETLFVGRIMMINQMKSSVYIGNIRQLCNMCFISESDVEIPISEYYFLTIYDRDVEDISD